MPNILKGPLLASILVFVILTLLSYISVLIVVFFMPTLLFSDTTLFSKVSILPLLENIAVSFIVFILLVCISAAKVSKNPYIRFISIPFQKEYRLYSILGIFIAFIAYAAMIIVAMLYGFGGVSLNPLFVFLFCLFIYALVTYLLAFLFGSSWSQRWSLWYSLTFPTIIFFAIIMGMVYISQK